jgi:hypothetical protein
MQFYKCMTSQFPGSVVLIDSSGAGPIAYDETAEVQRVHRSPLWDIQTLAAALEACDLFVGIDSGPSHLARLVDARMLFVTYPTLPARHVALPHERTRFLVPQDHADAWRHRGQLGWESAAYPGRRPSAGEIAEQALEMLGFRETIHVSGNDRYNTSLVKRVAAGRHGTGFAVGFPHLWRSDTLNQAIDAALAGTAVPEVIYVIDNGGTYLGHPSSKVQVIRPPCNLGCAASWNVLHSLCPDRPLIILNDDMLVGRTTFERMLANPAGVVFGTTGANEMAVMLVRRDAYQQVGPFDEDFYPYTWEDSDYLRRLKLAGITPAFQDGDPVTHANGGSSSTVHVEQTLRRQFTDGWARCRDRYIAKWGGDIGNEKFNVPFGGAK